MKLILGDCLNEMNTIENNSVSLFLLDLPFGITAKKWDIPVPLDELWKLIKLKMKPDANILFFCNTSFGNKLINSNPDWYSYDLIWEKSRPTGHLNSSICPLRAHESIYIFKNGRTTYNPQMVERAKPVIQKRKAQKKRNGLYQQFGEIKERTYTHKFPTSILKFGSVHKPIHSTQKPQDLLEWLINTYSNEADLICDPTMGVGSTAVACKKMGREFIGIELNEKYFNLAKDRIENI